MSGTINFGNLRHFSEDNGKCQYYVLTMMGESIKEYTKKSGNECYGMYLPLLGTFWDSKNRYDPDKLADVDWYDVVLKDDQFVVKRKTSRWG